MRSICVFCGSSRGGSPAYAAAAAAMGTEIARRGWRLVYGGGDSGVMGLLASAALAGGGEVVGVIPRRLAETVGQPPGVELRVVEGMHERKALMAELAEAFVALPGGLGTLDELFEAWTWRQLGWHRKPVGLLEVDGYFAPLLAFLEGAAREGFLARVQLEALIVREDPTALLDALASPPPLPAPKLGGGDRFAEGGRMP